MYGRDNKYLRIAKRINEQYGYSVVVSANPVEYDCNLELEVNYISDELGAYDEMYFIDISNGAIIGARQGFGINGIQKMLLINGPLMINYHKTIKGIKAFGVKPIDVVYGENDPSAMYTVWLENEKISNCDVRIIPGADHNFSGMEDVFEDIIVRWGGELSILKSKGVISVKRMFLILFLLGPIQAIIISGLSILFRH